MFLTVSKGRSLAPADQNKQRFQGRALGEGIRGRSEEGTLPCQPQRRRARAPAPKRPGPHAPAGLGEPLPC